MLTLRKLNQYYGESHTLWDIDLELKQGDCLCLMGRNGVGKTTLLKTIMGLIKPQGGEIYFSQQAIHDKKVDLRAKLGIAYVPQGREIFPQLTVEENLKIGLVNGIGIRRIPEKVFDIFPVLKQMLNRRGGDLSGGQQQQLAIGRALAITPKLIILDEPTEGIQPNIVSEIGEIIQRLNQQDNITILLVEQKLAFARRVATDYCIMQKGRLVASGLMQDLQENIIKQHLLV